MKKTLLFFCALIFSATAGAVVTNHSMTIVQISVTSTRVDFIAEATDVTSLNLPMQAVVCNIDNTQFVTGNTETFTSVGEQIPFSVNIGSLDFTNAQVLVALTDFLPVTDCNNGAEGYIDAFQVASPTIPTLGGFGLGALALVLVGGAWFGRRRLVSDQSA